MKDFNKFFLNESIKKRFQYKIDKIDIDEFNNDFINKTDELDVETNINILKGVNHSTFFFNMKCDNNESIDHLIEWIKNNY